VAVRSRRSEYGVRGNQLLGMSAHEAPPLDHQAMTAQAEDAVACLVTAVLYLTDLFTGDLPV
jgi:hypothetical protein